MMRDNTATEGIPTVETHQPRPPSGSKASSRYGRWNAPVRRRCVRDTDLAGAVQPQTRRDGQHIGGEGAVPSLATSVAAACWLLLAVVPLVDYRLHPRRVARRDGGVEGVAQMADLRVCSFAVV